LKAQAGALPWQNKVGQTAPAGAPEAREGQSIARHESLPQAGMTVKHVEYPSISPRGKREGGYRAFGLFGIRRAKWRGGGKPHRGFECRLLRPGNVH